MATHIQNYGTLIKLNSANRVKTMNRERIERIAIDALNKAHSVFGLKQIMKCDFCTSRASDNAVAYAIEQAIAEREQEIIDWLEQQPVGSGKYMAERLKAEVISND